MKLRNIFLVNVVMFACATAAMLQQALDTVTMAVYYESLGKHSQDFITKQLYPTYVAVNKGYLSMNTPMKLELVPYGDCQGETTASPPVKKETCAYNKLHACAISLSLNENNWTPLNFINCIMTIREGYDLAPNCAVKTCFDDRLMAPCMNTVDGDKILGAHINRTISSNIPTTNLPIVTFNGVYSEKEQDKARTNLLALVCDKIDRKSAVCRSPRASETMTHKNFGSGIYYPERIHCFFWVNNRHWGRASNTPDYQGFKVQDRLINI